MGFTEVLFLAAGLAVVGPILAHLVSRTPVRRVPFTMLQFLELSRRQTQARRRLQDLLILLLRCAIILLLALVFAGPVLYRPVVSETARDRHVLVLDNSLSMSARYGGETALDRLKSAARVYIDDAEGGVRSYTLFATQGGTIGQDLSADAARSELSRLEVSAGPPHRLPFGALMESIAAHEGRDDTLHVAVFTDGTPEFLRGFLRPLRPMDVTNRRLDIVAPDEPVANAAVAQVRVLDCTPGTVRAAVTVANRGTEACRRLVALELDGVASPEQWVDLAPGAARTVDVQLEHDAPWDASHGLALTARLRPSDALEADDTYPVGIAPRGARRLHVLLLGSPQQTALIAAALEGLEGDGHSDQLRIIRAPFTRVDPLLWPQVDVVFAAHCDASLDPSLPDMKRRVEDGMRAVFFQHPEAPLASAESFYRAGLLPALPLRRVTRAASMEPVMASPSGAALPLLQVLGQYGIEQTPLWSYFQCRTALSARGLWRIDPEAYLLYEMPLGAGAVLYVNTSMDDAQSGLTKSAACPAFVRYLVGGRAALRVLAAASTEPAVLPVEAAGASRPADLPLLDGAGAERTARLTGDTYVCAAPHAPGWLRPAEPTGFALGIHADARETDLVPLREADLASVLADAFPQRTEAARIETTASAQRRAVPIQKAMIWLLIGCIGLESIAANRMQR